MPDTQPHAPITHAAILAAAARLKGRIERTPMARSRTLSEMTGAEVWIKFENLHFTAAFKERGALNKLLQMPEAEKRRGVIAASAGNHAQALAYHAQRLGVPTTIVMPQATPFVKVEQTRHWGAEVVLDGDTFDDAYAAALGLCEAAPIWCSCTRSTMPTSSSARARRRWKCWPTLPTSTCWLCRLAAAG